MDKLTRLQQENGELKLLLRRCRRILAVSEFKTEEEAARADEIYNEIREALRRAKANEES
jgi:hypothetical protein